MRTTTRCSMLAAVFIVACSGGGGEADPTVDHAAMDAARADSLAEVARAEAPALIDSAKATLATLLEDPASAVFDSIVVIQPSLVDGRQPALAVCGRIGGRPGVGGSAVRVRFIYQGKWTVFVEDSANGEKFAELWDGTCDVVGGTVVVRE